MSLKKINIIHLPEVSSTNAYAKKLLRDQKPPEGTMIQADFQTAGRGQDKNNWESEAGKNILVTIILYPDFLEVSDQFKISMAVALGIIDFLEDVLPAEELYIKWPNDIYVGNKKIGGILINNEVMGNHFDHVIAGIGINLNQEGFSAELPNPVSAYNLTGIEYDIEKETLRLRDFVMKRYESMRPGDSVTKRRNDIMTEQIETDYYKYLLGLNEEREFIYQGKRISATIKGVNEFGHLELDTEIGTISCDLKEIIYKL